MSTPVSLSGHEDETGGAVDAAALDELIIDVISRRALTVLASTPLDEGEYIAHGLWGHELAAQLATVLRMLDYDAEALAHGMVGWTRTPATYLYLKDIQKADNPLV
ncbi:MAG: hypothetical protein WC935_00705 [Thermoleophilia bacterium]